jgi:putative membrane protein
MQSERPASVRRLHPISPLFRIGASARSLIIPGLIFLFASRGGGGSLDFWFFLIIIPIVFGAVIQYWFYRYRLEGDEMVVREGILFRNERHIPYARIQNIDLVQKPLHRLFNVAEARVETASGGKPEAVLQVLSLEAVETMRTSVFRDREAGAAAVTAAAADSMGTDAPASPVASETVVHEMSSKDVFLFGIISNKGMVVVAAAFGLLWQFDPWERIGVIEIDSIEQAEAYLPGSPFGNAVVWAFLKFHGFRLRRLGDDLRAEYGLLTRVSKTIPRHRIQVLSIRESLLHRLFGCAAVQVETAGGGGDENSSGSDRLWLAPIVRKDRLAELFAEALPGVSLDDVDWQPISPRARRRIVRVILYAMILPVAGLVFGLGPWALLIPVAALPWVAFHSARWVRHAGYSLSPGAVFFRSGWWVRRLSVARFGKMQVIQLGQSPFDRRHDMASVRVDTAGAGPIGHGIEIPYLDAPVARELSERLSDEAGRTRFEW